MSRFGASGPTDPSQPLKFPSADIESSNLLVYLTLYLHSDMATPTILGLGKPAVAEKMRFRSVTKLK